MTPETPPPARGTPAADHAIDAALVRALLAEQHPDLAGLVIAPAATGWDNAMFRLGETLSVRLPRRAVAAALLENEQHWLPTLAPHLPLPVPAPVRLGLPGCGYPWRWSVLPWLEGAPADLAPLLPDQGAVLGGFLRALHVPAPADAPFNRNRSISLRVRSAMTEPQLARVAARTELIDERIARIWREGLRASIDLAPSWIHGDMHARNVLSVGGEISGVIDWGDMARGDPATDLCSIWMLLPDVASRRQAMAAYGATSEATWARARGWAVAYGAVLMDAGGVDDPRLEAMGRLTLERLIEGP
ncbi:MAG TPA: aminoglycoside phosphotransferase family protein [Caulobacteraceae bacterium]